MSRPSQAPRRRRRRRIRAFSILRMIALLFVWGVSFAAATIYVVIVTVNAELPADLRKLADYQPSRKSLVYSSDGEEVGEFSIENRKIVPLDRMPPHVPAAFISVEDSRFWEHPGFDIVGILRAAWANVGSSDIKQGGSTIPQQIVKQTLLAGEEDVDPTGLTEDQFKSEKKHKKYIRKIKELILSARLSRELSKAEILQIYLNHVYLGHGAYGVGAAAEIYFGKDVENLTVGEGAMLAGLVSSPTKYAPTNNLKLARERQEHVLDRMQEDGYIGEGEHAAALAEPVALVDSADLNHLAAPYFVEHVRQLATQTYGDSELFRGGLRFYTTLDTRMQAAAEVALRHGLETLDRRLGVRGPIGAIPPAERAAYAAGPAHRYRKVAPDAAVGELATDEHVLADITYAAMVTELPRGGGITVDLGPQSLPMIAADATDLRAWKNPKTGKPLAQGDLLPVRIAEDGKAAILAQTPSIQGALVALEPQTGRVVAMVGGYDWVTSQYDRATQAHRQVGSSIKPFIYASALAAGRTEVDRLYDGPVYVPTATGIWSPANYDNKYMGSVTLRTAIAYSLNTISVQLLVGVGVDRLIEVLHGFGITSKVERHISIALGTPDLTLLEMAGAYAGLAAGGRRIDPHFFDLVTDAGGAIIDDYRARPPGPQVLPPDVAYVIVDMMKGPLQRGTARRAMDFPRPAAGKTGTSANYKDVWFIGFTTDLLCGVWIGRDDSTPIGDKITGGGAAVPIWLEFMKAAHPPTPIRDFPVPPGITFARGEEWSGDPAGPGPGATWIPFARGTLPTRYGGGRSGQSFQELVPAPAVP
ncbi:MAG: PBP1A family penicillin-binding protein [Deltaproteobacteria bacterium]|nr:PBP1A family penicillin-binding protein [Deltaproteobacteria bacterium]